MIKMNSEHEAESVEIIKMYSSKRNILKKRDMTFLDMDYDMMEMNSAQKVELHAIADPTIGTIGIANNFRR